MQKKINTPILIKSNDRQILHKTYDIWISSLVEEGVIFSLFARVYLLLFYFYLFQLQFLLRTLKNLLPTNVDLTLMAMLVICLMTYLYFSIIS
jgi:hypothetical protein